MQSKKEAIEILKANLENAINCNDTYMCSVIHRKGCIFIRDAYGEFPLKYDIAKKTLSYEDIKESFKDRECVEPNRLTEIVANTNAIKHLLKDMRAMLSNHTINQVFVESQCDHILGTNLYGIRATTQSDFIRVSDNKRNFEIHKLFYFCPECGSKLR